MEFGPHTLLVEEVIAFVRSGTVINATAAADPGTKAVVLTDLCRAVEMNLGQQEAVFFRSDVTSADEDDSVEWCWQDLLETSVALLIHTEDWHAKPDNGRILDTLHELFFGREIEGQLLRHLCTQLPNAAPSADWGDPLAAVAKSVQADLYHIAENRAFNGMTDNFWERLFAFYRAGFWPCGWEGTYPEPGRFVVYRP